MSVGINELYDMLDSDDEEIQQQGIEEGAKVKYLSVFILPGEGKGIWLNCAKILAGKTDEELEPYLLQIFEWFQDGNWPGFDIIYARLRKIPAKKIADDYSYMIFEASRRCKDDREKWLTWLSGLIWDKELLELLPIDQQELMKKYFKKWWATHPD